MSIQQNGPTAVVGRLTNAKKRGNKIHARLLRLALAYVKEQHPRVAERLKRRAKREEAQ